MAILLLMLFWKCGFRLWPNGHAHTQCLNKKDFHLIHWWKWTTWASHVVSKVLPHSSLKRTCFLQKRNNNYRIIISNINNNSTKITATKINFHNIPFEPAVNMLWIFLFPPVKSEGKRKLEFYFWSRNVLPSLEPWGRRTAVPSFFPQSPYPNQYTKYKNTHTLLEVEVETALILEVVNRWIIRGLERRLMCSVAVVLITL